MQKCKMLVVLCLSMFMASCATTATSYVSRDPQQIQRESSGIVDLSKHVRYRTHIYKRLDINNVRSFQELALKEAAVKFNCDFVAHPTIIMRKFFGRTIVIRGYEGYYQSDTTNYVPF